MLVQLLPLDALSRWTSRAELNVWCCGLAQGGRTVPRIFVDQQFIGGADDVAALDSSGELERLLLEKGLVGEEAAGSAA